MMTINLLDKVGKFGENKDIARDIRIKEIIPALQKRQEIILDFTGMDGATQSFIHALISELMRMYGDAILDRISFKGCNETIQKIINLVIDYMQESI